jgi:Xaa-Pro aminopeptidase
MRTTVWIVVLALIGSSYTRAAENELMRERRQRAATAFHDGILFLHAKSELDISTDGFRQDPFFYYFTGLENTAGAVLAIEGNSGQCWLFLPSRPPFLKSGLQPEVHPGPEALKRLGIQHIEDWSALDGFLTQRAGSAPRLYYADDPSGFEQLPPALLSRRAPRAPLWVQIILQKWPTSNAEEVAQRVEALMAVQSAQEIEALRLAAKATVSAVMVGMRAIRPGVSQRSVEAVVENACWTAGAHGSAFWPWAMAGENGVFPHPFTSLARYDHLNRVMRSTDLVRLDVGCEWNHYQGDLGRTVPVSGQYKGDQRETWNIFVAAYHSGVEALRDGVTVDQVFEAWRTEMLRHRAAARTPLAQRAIRGRNAKMSLSGRCIRVT